MPTPKPQITLIGAGNVGTHLALRFCELGFPIQQVFSRTNTKARKLAKQVNAAPCQDLKEVDNSADIYIIAVHDDGIKEVANTLSSVLSPSKIVAHTSGSTSVESISEFFSNYGIFYPLQTFTKDIRPDFSTLPICINGGNFPTKKQLKELANEISGNVYEITEEERQILHVTAVMVNNFTNRLFALAEEILDKEQISFEILKPLILETVNKIKDNKAADIQTGPAARGDEQTIKRHLEYLKQFPGQEKIYKIMTESILTRNNRK